MDTQVVLFRAELSGHPNCSQVLSYIEHWVRVGHASVLNNNSISLQASCPIEVESLTAQAECSRLTTTATTTTITTTPTGALNDNGEGFGVIGPVIGGLGGVIFAVGVLTLGAVVVYVYRHKKQKAIYMDSNRAYGIPNRRDYQNPVWHCGESNAMAEPEEEHTYEEVA